MLRRSGQAAVELGHTLRRIFGFLLTVALLLSVAAVGLAWRVSRGPLELSFLKDRLEAAVNKGIDPARVTMGDVSIAWRGFSHGLNQPLVLRVTDLTVDQKGSSTRVHIPVAEAALSARGLVTGRIMPRTITLEGPRLSLLRRPDGSIGFDLGDPSGASEPGGPTPVAGILAVLGAPPGSDLEAGGQRLSQLSSVSVHGAELSVDDRLLGMAWSAQKTEIDLSRHSGGGMDGQIVGLLGVGGEKARLTGRFNLAPSAKTAHVVARLSQVTPKALAASAPILAPLAALDAPVTLDGEADLGLDLAASRLRLTVRAGAGKVNTGGGAIPVRRAEFVAAGTLEQATLERMTIEFQPQPGGEVSTVTGSGSLTHQADRLAATLHLTLDRVGFANLPALWPANIGSPARAWITRNILGGIAHDGQADLALEARDDMSDITLLRAAGTLEGDDLVVTWLPDVPPIEQGKAHLVLTDPDKVDIAVRTGRQTVKGADPIALRDGRVIVTGLTKKDQVATIKCELNGSVPSAIVLLKEPRLRILDRHPMPLTAPAGDLHMTLQAVIPLLLDLRFDDVTMHGTGSLSKVHLTGILAGRDLDDGAVTFGVNTNGLTLKGTARLAGIPASIEGMMDFRSGPPSQVTQRFMVSGKTAAPALAEAGLNAADVLTGEVGLNASLTEYRSGTGELAVDADLTQAVLTISPLAWRKPAGTAAKGSARLVLSRDRLVNIDRVVVDGLGVQVRGAIAVQDGRPDVVRLDRAAFGRTDIRGSIRLPRNGPIGVDVAGPALDVSLALREKPARREAAAGPAWSMQGRFDRVFLAHEQTAGEVAVSAENDGVVYRGLTISGKGGSGKPFAVTIGPNATTGGKPARRLTIDAQDAGPLLRGLDITGTIQHGTLRVTGGFDDSGPDHILAGTLELSDFGVTHVAALGKLLQAVTLYGLVDALSGPGLSFSRLIAPFTLTDDTMILHDARAFSSSLGVTAKGRIDRAAERLDLQGTVVPAYIFNSLLGRLPLIGRLFRAEEGGGLIAMNYALRGPMDDPTVLANPLSALTPGILRGMFGLFDQTPPDRPATGGNAP